MLLLFKLSFSQFASISGQLCFPLYILKSYSSELLEFENIVFVHLLFILFGSYNFWVASCGNGASLISFKAWPITSSVDHV